MEGGEGEGVRINKFTLHFWVVCYDRGDTIFFPHEMNERCDAHALITHQGVEKKSLVQEVRQKRDISERRSKG